MATDPDTTRLAADIPTDKHRALKALLAERGQTISEWLVKMVDREIQKEKK